LAVVQGGFDGFFSCQVNQIKMGKNNDHPKPAFILDFFCKVGFHKDMKVYPLLVVQSEQSRLESLQGCAVCLGVVTIAGLLYADDAHRCMCATEGCALFAFCSKECCDVYQTRLDKADSKNAVFPCQIIKLPIEAQLAVLYNMMKTNGEKNSTVENVDRSVMDVVKVVEELFPNQSGDLVTAVIESQKKAVKIVFTSDFGEYALDFEGFAIYPDGLDLRTAQQEIDTACLQL
jgi:hypothetical protein